MTNKVCVPHKTEDINLTFFSMITGINEPKISAKHESCKCECKFDCGKCNSNQNWNNDKCLRKCKNKKKFIVCARKIIFGILLQVVVRMVNM